jgi:hypothetical protein
VGSSSHPAALPVREDQRMTRSRAMPSGTGSSEPRRPVPHQADPLRRSEEKPPSAHQIYDGSERLDSDSLRRRRSRRRSSDSTTTPSVPPVAEPSAAPRCLKSLLIRGSGALEVHVSLVTGGAQGPPPAVVEVGGSASERAREKAAAIEASVKVDQPPSRRGRGALPPSRGRSAQPSS